MHIYLFKLIDFIMDLHNKLNRKQHTCKCNLIMIVVSYCRRQWKERLEMYGHKKPSYAIVNNRKEHNQ